MRQVVQDALRAGAIGFSTSRSSTHVTPDGTPVASRIGDWHEVATLVGAMGELGAGIFQLGPDVSSGAAHRACLAEVAEISRVSGRPAMFGILSTRQGVEPNPWQSQVDYLDDAASTGSRLIGQATTRSINAIFSFESYLPFDKLPGWRELRDLPIDEQQRRLRDPQLRRELIAAEGTMKARDDVFQGGGAATTDPRKPDYGNLFAMKSVDWDDPSVAELAAETGKHPVEVMIDLALDNDMQQLFVQPLVNEAPDDVLGILKHPRTLATFSDSGAHVCQEMGSSLQTHLLSYWVRGKQAFTLEEGVRMLTHDNAVAWEMRDRGVLREGFAADVVIFDEHTIKPCMPTVEKDLPGGSRRLVQKAEGIVATIVNGEVALENGMPTGIHAGQLLTGPLST
jgi:N-acyl-D-aspartate/D-glutamate deacylase